MIKAKSQASGSLVTTKFGAGPSQGLHMSKSIVKTDAKIEVVIKERLYIPMSVIARPEVFEKRYSKSMYSQENCKKCSFLPDRHSAYCDECPQFKGHYITFRKEIKNGINYYSIPRAELYKLSEIGIHDYTLIDKTVSGAKLNSKLTLTRELYSFQEVCKNEVIKGDGRKNYIPHGVIKAPPRSGKCVVGGTLIHTSYGTVPISSLFSSEHKDGETIAKEISLATWKGVKTTSAIYKKVVDKTVKVSTEYGFSIRGTENHPLLVLNNKMQHVWKNLEDIKLCDTLCLQRSNSVWPENLCALTSIKHPILNIDIARLLGYFFNAEKVDDTYQIYMSTEVAMLDIQELLGVLKLKFVSNIRAIVIAEADIDFLTNYVNTSGITQDILSSPEIVVKNYVTTLLRNNAKVIGNKLTMHHSNTLFLTQLQVILLKLKVVAKLVGNTLTIQNSNNPTLDIFYDKVCSVKILRQKVEVYDVCVPDGNNFIANGIVSHNTLLSLAVAIELGGKTLILANQEDLLRQFIIELGQSTNINDIDKFEGKVSYGLCSKVEDFKKFDFCLATYQTFISANGKKKLDAIKNIFTTVIVEECHRSAAKCFSQVVDNLSARNRLGITATEIRKDGMDFILKQVIGEVTTTASIATLKPQVFVIETGIKSAYNYKTWNSAMQFLASNKDRINIIMENLKKDLKAGRKIVIPVMYKAQAQELVNRINALGYVAEKFVAGVDREKLLARARSGEIDVVVGIRSILSTGVNVPIWSAIYTISPISNPPNYYQETMRVCTPLPGKLQPIIRIFVDDLQMTKGCFRTCWFQTVLKHKFEVNSRHLERANAIFRTMNSSRHEENDEYKVFRDTGKKDTSEPLKGKTWKPIGLFK